MYEKSNIITIILDIINEENLDSKVYKTVKLWIVFECISNKTGALKDIDIADKLSTSEESISRFRILRNSIVHFNIKSKLYNSIYAVDSDGNFTDFDSTELCNNINNTLNSILINISDSEEIDNDGL